MWLMSVYSSNYANNHASIRLAVYKEQSVIVETQKRVSLRFFAYQPMPLLYEIDKVIQRERYTKHLRDLTRGPGWLTNLTFNSHHFENRGGGPSGGRPGRDQGQGSGTVLGYVAAAPPATSADATNANRS